MIDTISMYQMSCGQYEKHLEEFRKKKSQNLKDDVNLREKGRLEWDELSQNENQTVKSHKKINSANYICKMQSAAVLHQQTLNHQIIVLDLSNARLSNLNDYLNNLKQLQVINLANNLFNDIPTILLELPLVHINLNNNLLKNLQISKNWIRSLERMDVGRNHINSILPEISTLEKIQMVDVRSNDFTKLPVSFVQLQSKLCGLGIDWVRYSLDKYFPQRKDVLVEDDLQRFWQVLQKILRQQPDAESINCYDFLVCNEKWDDPQVPELIKAQQPRTSYITRATRRYSELTLQESNSNSFHYQGNRTQGQDLESSNGGNLMHTCVKNEDLGVLRTLIKTRFHLTSQMDDDDHTPLSLAIQEERYHCAKILISHKVDGNVGGYRGQYQSVLNIAITKIQYFLVKDILQLNVNINKTDIRGNGPLHNLIPAFKKNYSEATKIGYLLLECGANPNQLNKNFNSPFHLAIKKSLLSAVKFCLAFNQRVGQTSFSTKLLGNKRNSIMHFAAKSENIRIILTLYPIHPLMLFTYNAEGKRPFDIVQKNYTLSKLFQVLELIFLKEKVLQREIPQKKDQRQVQSMDQGVLANQQVGTSWNLQDSDDERNNIKIEMCNFQLQPKLKRANSSQNQQEKARKKAQTNKVSQELASPIIINKSIQQARNDIRWIERQNMLKRHHQGANCNKSVHRVIADVQATMELIQECHRAKDMSSLEVLHKVLRYQQEILNKARENPLWKMLIENAEKMQKLPDVDAQPLQQECSSEDRQQRSFCDVYEVFQTTVNFQ